MCSLCLAANFGMATSMMYYNPPSALVELVEKLVWHPDPFQSPLSIGFGSSSMETPNSSPILPKMYLANHMWSPHSIPLVIPT